MKQIFTIIGFLAMSLASAQDVKTSNYLSKIIQQDISDLWTLKGFQTEFESDTTWIERMDPIGYIGENYQRFYIHFTSVIKNPRKGLEYFVYGKTRVKTNICSFQGLMKINEAFIYNDIEYPFIKQGYVKGEYDFFEDPDQKGTGILKGKFTTEFYLDKSGHIEYNSLMFIADGFENNQFEGTWIGYKSTDSKKCNWGDYRIPDSRELDCGAAEFSVAEKFVSFGWNEYRIITGGNSDNKDIEAARKAEKEKWWIEKE